MELLFALLGLALPWLTGILCLLSAQRLRGRRCDKTWAIGYGLPLGFLLLVLWMLALNWLGIAFSVGSVGAPLLVLAGLSAWSLRRAARAQGQRDMRPYLPAVPLLTRPGRVVWAALLLLLALRGGQLALEIIARPSFLWDAWAATAGKAKAWESWRSLAPFGTPEQMLADTASYTDVAPDFPGGLPLLQTWLALCAGRWHDCLINLPWLAFALALGAGFYAQARHAGAGPLSALAASYLLLSLPILDVQVALPGIADLPFAVLLGLGSLALWRWSVERQIEHLMLALTLALTAALVKNAALPWLALLGLAALPILGRRGWQALIVLAGATTLGLAVGVQEGWSFLGTSGHLAIEPIAGVLAQTTLVFDNWHLLGYFVLFLVPLGARLLILPRYASLAVYVLGGLAGVVAALGVATPGWWTREFAAANRLLLPIAPAAVLLLLLFALHWRDRLREAASPAASPATEPEAFNRE